MPIKRNQLKADQKYRLYEALMKNRARFTEMTGEEVVEVFSKELGFTLTKINITAACKIMGIKLKRSQNRRGRGRGLRRIEFNRLQYVVKMICEKLGEDYDELAAEFEPPQPEKI